MNVAGAFGLVRPRYGILRRYLLPIYGVDQLVFVGLMAVPFVWLASVNPLLALYTGAGAYIGFVLTMQRSTPSSLLLPSNDDPRVAALLDRSPYFERKGDGQWHSTKGRLHRWDTDDIRIEHIGQMMRLTGRQMDLQKIAFQLDSKANSQASQR